MSQKRKVQTGKVVGTIILLLSFFSILCDMLKTKIVGFTSFAALIQDASAFLTIICIVFFIVEIVESNSYKFVFLYIIDIILINRLYSNARWSEILTKLRKIDKGMIVLAVIVAIIVLYVIYVLIIKREEKLEKSQGNVTEQMQDQEGAVTSRNKNQKGFGFFSHFLKKLCIGTIVWAFLDYMVYNQKLITIKRPIEVSWVSEILYYSAVICAVILIVQAFADRNKGTEGTEDTDIYAVSAFLALGLEVFVIVFNEKMNFSGMVGQFLNALSENWFVTLIAFIVFFMIMQICISILLGLLFPNKESNKLGKQFHKSIIRIEERMVELACNIIEGCIELMGFIPDFFTSIGALLLDEDIKLEKWKDGDLNEESKGIISNDLEENAGDKETGR